ncbi:MAG TPA: FHA domain-containing protein, partial [Polyangiaceae bacterium]|nr:FHA domain-containing protein [Polyangiaceae bacterium]
MWKLRIDTQEGETRWLDLREPEVTIGRAPSCALRLDERDVSRRHASLRRRADGGWALVEAGNRNGSFVNGRRARGEVALAPNDLVQIGDFLLTLCEGDVALAGPPRRAPASARRLVVVEESEGSVTEVPLAQARVTLGGRDGCMFHVGGPALDAALISVLAVDGGRHEVCDESPKPSLLVNGVVLARKVLDEGDLISIGDVTMVRRDARYGLALRYLGESPARATLESAPTPSSARASGRDFAPTPSSPNPSAGPALGPPPSAPRPSAFETARASTPERVAAPRGASPSTPERVAAPRGASPSTPERVAAPRGASPS